jgi:uridine phosphorylase
VPPASQPTSPAAAPAHPVALHLRPTTDLAERVLLPGDPGRALALAQKLISSPRMFNHHRGLWGYTGLALADGEPLTIQATGMGGPSAAIVLTELIALGARRAVRVGTCGALRSDLELGGLVVASEALCHDGCSRALARAKARPEAGWSLPAEDPAGLRATADVELTEALASAAGPRARVGPVMSVDLFYGDPPGTADPRARGAAATDPSTLAADPRAGVPVRTKASSPADGSALAVEMEAATLFAVGAKAGIPVGCVLAVSDVFDAFGARTRIDDDSLLSAAETMGAVAVTALGQAV